jgi:hypothetical protein
MSQHEKITENIVLDENKNSADPKQSDSNLRVGLQWGERGVSP